MRTSDPASLPFAPRSTKEPFEDDLTADTLYVIRLCKFICLQILPSIFRVLASVVGAADGFAGGFDFLDIVLEVEVVDKTRLKSPGGSDSFVAYATRPVLARDGDC